MIFIVLLSMDLYSILIYVRPEQVCIFCFVLFINDNFVFMMLQAYIFVVYKEQGMCQTVIVFYFWYNILMPSA